MYKHYNHEGGIASPCIIHWPDGGIRRGAIDDQPAHIIDLMPTIIQLTGATYSSPLELAGKNLIPFLRKEQSSPRVLFFEHEGNRAVHAGKYKLVAFRDEPWELYDIDDDRTELFDLASKHPDLVKQLEQLWDEWAASNDVTPMPKQYGVEYLRQPDR